MRMDRPASARCRGRRGGRTGENHDRFLRAPEWRRSGCRRDGCGADRHGGGARAGRGAGRQLAGTHGRCDQEARPTLVRRRHRHPGLRLPGRQGRLERLRRRLLPCHRRRRARRPGEGALCRHDNAVALHHPAIGRDRRADPRQHADVHPQRPARPGRDRDQFLRRSGLSGAQEPRREIRRRS